MKAAFRCSRLIPGVLTLLAGTGLVAETPLPLIDGKPVVATVNGAPITLDAFAEALAQAHEGATETGQSVPRQDPAELLARLIEVELVLQEAENIGLNELPRVRDAIDARATQTRRNLVLGRHAREVTVPDAERVEELYRQRIMEVRIDSILVESAEDAATIKSRIDAGGEFAALAREAVAGGTPNPLDNEQYLKIGDLRPVVREVLSDLEIGQVSPVIQVDEQFSVLQLIDIRYPEDPTVRQETEQAVLKQQRSNRAREYTETLKERYTSLDEELFESLDYSADGPGLESMLADQRVIAEVEGGDPVTVSELTELLEKKAFHGAERAIEQGRFGQRRHPILDDLLKKRAIDLEAKRLKIDETEQFRNMVNEYRKGVLFNTFLERAVDPSITLDEEELKRYLEEHAEEYSTPELVRIEALAFLERPDAEAALDKLRKGADFRWMGANAAGQVPAESDTDLLQLDGRMPLVTTALPDGIRQAVAGAQAGDFRFHAAPDGPSYVLMVREVIPARPRELDEVKDQVAGKVYGEKRQAAFDEWVRELRAVSEIEIFVTGDALLEALGMDPASPD